MNAVRGSVLIIGTYYEILIRIVFWNIYTSSLFKLLLSDVITFQKYLIDLRVHMTSLLIEVTIQQVICQSKTSTELVKLTYDFAVTLIKMRDSLKFSFLSHFSSFGYYFDFYFSFNFVILISTNLGSFCLSTLNGYEVLKNIMGISNLGLTLKHECRIKIVL